MEVFDRNVAFQNANGDGELVKKRCSAFSESAEAALATVQVALQSQDPTSLELVVQELRAASTEVGAAGIDNLAEQFLAALGDNDWNQMNALTTKLLMELGWFQRIIDERACSGNL